MDFESCTLAKQILFFKRRWQKRLFARRLTLGSNYLSTGKRALVLVAKRGCKIVLKVLPFKLAPPGASPPVESKIEIEQSQILKFLGDPKQIRLYSDGAKAWQSICQKSNIKKFPVVHGKHQFTRKLKVMKKPGATLAGTQAVDRWWQPPDHYIPSSFFEQQRLVPRRSESEFDSAHACICLETSSFCRHRFERRTWQAEVTRETRRHSCFEVHVSISCKNQRDKLPNTTITPSEIPTRDFFSDICEIERVKSCG